MKSLLNKIFSGKSGIGKFFISGIAFLLGLTLVLISVQAYFKIQKFLNPEKNLSGYLILNKEVGLGHTIFGGKAEFTGDEIDDLKKQDFVKDVGKFTNSNFRVVLDISGNFGLSEGMFMDIAFESVPDRFIDDKPYNFKWSPDDNFLPIIVSQDFLNLYNFSYALRMGTPQLSPSTIRMIPFKIEVSGSRGKRILNGKIVGFTERIPSVLVPESFIDWANNNIGSSNSSATSRVIVKVNGEKSGSLQAYMNEHGLKLSEDKLQLSRISNMIVLIMSILFIIGAAFILFALVIVIMNFSLMISEAKEEIRLLFQLGYKTKYIMNYLIQYLSLFMLIVSLSSVILFILINSSFNNYLNKNGINISSSVEMETFISGIIFIIISYLITFISVFKVLKKNSKV